MKAHTFCCPLGLRRSWPLAEDRLQGHMAARACGGFLKSGYHFRGPVSGCILGSPYLWGNYYVGVGRIWAKVATAELNHDVAAALHGFRAKGLGFRVKGFAQLGTKKSSGNSQGIA